MLNLDIFSHKQILKLPQIEPRKQKELSEDEKIMVEQCCKFVIIQACMNCFTSSLMLPYNTQTILSGNSI